MKKVIYIFMLLILSFGIASALEEEEKKEYRRIGKEYFKAEIVRLRLAMPGWGDKGKADEQIDDCLRRLYLIAITLEKIR